MFSSAKGQWMSVSMMTAGSAESVGTETGEAHLPLGLHVLVEAVSQAKARGRSSEPWGCYICPSAR